MTSCVDCGKEVKNNALRCHPCAVSYGMRFIVRVPRHQKKCQLCGKHFTSVRSDARLCSAECNSANALLNYRAKKGINPRTFHMPAEIISDGLRRCRWCQVEIAGRASKQFCGGKHKELARMHNHGISRSSTVMSRRV